MEIRNKIIMKDINSLKSYPKNNKKHPENQITLLKKNIEEFGFNVPLLIDQENNIVAGHARLIAAKELNLIELPCIQIDDLDENQIKALRIADNRIGELAETDWDNLKDEFDNLKDVNFDIDLTGYCEDDFINIKESKEIKEE